MKMTMTEESWHAVRNITGVTGFVGPMGRPIPLTEDEIRRMHLEKLTVTTEFKVGDKVNVIDGALEGFVGEIESINAAASKCKVIVSMFGRATPVELELNQIELIENL